VIGLLAAIVTIGSLASSQLPAPAAGALPTGPRATASWSVVASPSPQHGASGQLSGVACPTDTRCLVAGAGPRDDNPPYLGPPTLGEFQPSGWAPDLAEFPTGSRATSGQLNAVACATSTTCFAVGSSFGAATKTLIERWNGRWAPVASPNPPGATNVSLDGIACASASRCFAVGNYTKGSRVKTLVERWNGSGWGIVPSPSPAGSTTRSALAAIACPGPRACFAVGRSTPKSAFATLIEAWNGTSWSIVSSPNPTAGTYELAAISCSTTVSCLAVGLGLKGTTPTTLALRWNGTAWSLLKSAIPGNAASLELDGVACVTAKNCFAVGSIGTNELIARWNGTRWTRFPTLTRGQLDAISCTSATRCVAVGAGSQTLVTVWDGKTWSISHTGGSTSRLTNVSCSSTTDCLAIGENSYTLTVPFVEHWDGSAWSGVATPTLTTGPLYYLLGTSCPATGSCIVVGEQTATNGNGLSPLALEWNGTTWTVLDVPALPGVYGGLFDVSCASPTSCFAVGYTFGSSTTTLVEHWDGAAWSRMTSPNRATRYNLFWSISCVSTSSCFAVGDSSAGSRNSTLVERWNGTAWSIVPSPGHAGSTNDLQDVACASTTSCVATGAWSTGSTYGPLFEKWNGTTWTIGPMAALPAGARFSGPDDVACATSTNCVAVGTHDPGPSSRSVVERWDGSKWSLEATPAVGEADGLLGATCTDTGGCVAVGSSMNLGSEFTLVERSAQ